MVKIKTSKEWDTIAYAFEKDGEPYWAECFIARDGTDDELIEQIRLFVKQCKRSKS